MESCSYLFENLQKMHESENNRKIVKEANNLSIVDFNRIKQTLNKRNTLKDIFVLTPINYDNRSNRYLSKMEIGLYFVDYINNTLQDQDDWTSKHAKDYVGSKYSGAPTVYNVLIDFINETFKIRYDIDGIDNYFERNRKTIDKYLELHDMNFSKFVNEAKTIIENSKEDLSNLLNSKNFLYNLNKNHNHKDEQKFDIELTEALDESTPRWLRNGINASNDLKYYTSIPLDKIKWVEVDAPGKGKWDESKIHAFLINRNIDGQVPDYFVYVPKLGIGYDETIYVNGRERDINKMSVKALNPYIVKYAYVDNKDELTQSVFDKRKERSISKKDVINRFTNDDVYGMETLDKSGYVVDPNKYKRKLAQLNQEKYSDRLEDLYNALIGVKSKLLEISANNNFIADPKDRYANSGIQQTFKKALDKYNNATLQYSFATKYLDDIRSENTSTWSGEGFENFDKAIKSAEEYIVSAYDEINKD